MCDMSPSCKRCALLKWRDISLHTSHTAAKKQKERPDDESHEPTLGGAGGVWTLLVRRGSGLSAGPEGVRTPCWSPESLDSLLVLSGSGLSAGPQWVWSLSAAARLSHQGRRRRGKCFSRKPGNKTAALGKPNKEERKEKEGATGGDRQSEETQAVGGETGSQRRDRQSKEESQAVGGGETGSPRRSDRESEE